MVIHSTEDIWARSPIETAGPVVSQAVASQTTDIVRGPRAHIEREWGRLYECACCGQRYWSWTMEAFDPARWRCVSCIVAEVHGCQTDH